ncbi:DUF1998 domain-containing protein [Streptomyces sp. WAC08241]|uniref:DUF1998 domain-containing protein n=1 Tax=Streptomyces sp. WAC08241 TaxID=2487421 RepID=UPI000F76FD3B|nr:DUF1998 domain-containing protein [Streptomyces sp. WAC08241]RSS45058.1 hypothetical protein EF906_05555 [Streptomyces sp. WAC08241]
MRTLVDDPALAARVIRDISPPALPVPADATDPVLKELAEDGYSTVVRLPLRRGKRGAEAPKQEPVLLAHQLTTEALRILLPAATVLVDEKVHSFRAALRLGVDRHFGGDPAHLDTTLATMPDTATGERRHFLVLYDRLPGGTGYLDRLKKPDAFRDTLDEDGRPLTDDEGNPVSHWATKEIPTTAAIGLDRQVESDLEARFLAALRTWSTGQDDAALEESGAHSGLLRFAGAAAWRLTAQRDEEFTRTDFTFERTDGTPQKVHVFLDGHRFHATRTHNRIASDSRKRDELRAGGALVFQVTWDDLELFEKGERARAHPVWPPYRRTGQDTAKDWYEELGGDRVELAEAVFANPIDTLLGYLRDPSRTRWGRRAQALVGGLLSAPEPLARNVDPAQARATLRGALGTLAEGGNPAFDLEPVTGNGEILVLSATDEHGLALLYTVDPSGGPDGTAGVGWGALAVLDDQDQDQLGTAAHKLRWRSWLYWSNLLQFLAFTGGDGVQLAGSRAADFAVEVLRASGGPGELETLIARLRPGTAAVDATAPADVTEPTTGRPTASSSLEQAIEGLLRDEAWDKDILEFLEEDEPDSDLTQLAKTLAARGKKAPVFGYELGDRGWQADFAWPGATKVAVFVDSDAHDSEERQKRDNAYTGDGWTARTAADWLDHLDTLLTLLPDTEGTSHR